MRLDTVLFEIAQLDPRAQDVHALQIGQQLHVGQVQDTLFDHVIMSERGVAQDIANKFFDLDTLLFQRIKVGEHFSFILLALILAELGDKVSLTAVERIDSDRVIQRRRTEAAARIDQLDLSIMVEADL